jgi:hypothetical protein
VNAGDTIVGTITRCSAPCTWLVGINDTTINQSATLQVTTSTAFPVIVGGVLEADGNVQLCGQYPSTPTPPAPPATGQTAFDVALTDQSGNPLPPAWTASVVGTIPPCGYTVLLTTPASGHMILVY